MQTGILTQDRMTQLVAHNQMIADVFNGLYSVYNIWTRAEGRLVGQFKTSAVNIDDEGYSDQVEADFQKACAEVNADPTLLFKDLASLDQLARQGAKL